MKLRRAGRASSVYWQKNWLIGGLVADGGSGQTKGVAGIGFTARHNGTAKRHQWGRPALVLAMAMALQAAILLLAVLIGVMDPVLPKEAPLKLSHGSPTVQREQRQQAVKAAAQIGRLQEQALQQLMQPVMESMKTEISVPQPELVNTVATMGAMLPVDSFFAGGLEASVAGADLNSLPPPDPVEFLGESLQAKRVVLLLDISASVKTKMEQSGMSMEQLRTEVLQFIEQLGPNHLFGLIQFSRKWQVFRSTLVPATVQIKAEARDWMHRSFRTTGTSGRNWSSGYPNGIEAVLSAAFAMDPQLDEVFILSDGDFQRTPPGGGGQDVPWTQLRDHTRHLQDQSIGETRLRILCFHPPATALPDLRAWVQENGPGTLRVVQGKTH